MRPFIGLENYTQFFTRRPDWKSGVTIIFTVATVVGSMVLGLLLAVVLNRKRPVVPSCTAVFHPMLSGVGIGLV